MLRIVGGTLGGRRIKAPSGDRTRPTAERTREGVFNILTHCIGLEGIAILDLFAGSGAYGIEALSRGAAHGTFVESHRRTAAGIKENLSRLDIPAERWKIVSSPAAKFLGSATSGESWQLVFVDPPYAEDHYEIVLPHLVPCARVAQGAHIVVECPAGRELPDCDGLEQIQVNRYGDTQVVLLIKADRSEPT